VLLRSYCTDLNNDVLWWDDERFEFGGVCISESHVLGKTETKCDIQVGIKITDSLPNARSIHGQACVRSGCLWQWLYALLFTALGTTQWNWFAQRYTQRSTSVGLNSWPLRTCGTARTDVRQKLVYGFTLWWQLEAGHVLLLLQVIARSREQCRLWRPSDNRYKQQRRKWKWRQRQACRNRTELRAKSRTQLDILGHNACHIPLSFFGCESAMQNNVRAWSIPFV